MMIQGLCAALQALLPAAAFVLLALAVGQGVLCFVRGGAAPAREPWDRKATLWAGLLCFAACALGVAFFALCGFARGAATPEQAFAAVFPSSIDADHYLKLAQYGYQNGEAFQEQYLMIVFFPLFPWLVRALHAVTGAGFYTAGTLVQPVLFALGGAAFYRLVQPRFGRGAAAWALCLLAVSPAAFFFASPMTESLYFALGASALLMLDTERPAAFAALGFAAALTRSTGGLLACAAGIAFLAALRAGETRRAVRWLAAAFGPAAGTGVYLCMNRVLYGDWLAFSKIQKQHWDQGLGWVWDTVKYHVGYVFGWWESNRSFAVYISLAALVCIFAELALLALCARRLPLPWLGYAVAYLLVADGATWLLSAPRYALSMPVFALCAALVCKKRPQRIGAAVLLAGAAVLYLRCYLAGGPIY